MLRWTKEGSKVIIYVVLHAAWKDWTYSFSYECGSEWAAALLYEQLNRQLKDRISEVREEEFRRGRKSVRKVKQNEWFRADLELRKD